MTNPRPLPAVPLALVVCAALAPLCATRLHAVPPEAVTALIGQWSGESAHSPAGEVAERRFADARRYWLEGGIVRGELLSGAGDSLRSYRLAIVPRGNHLLKIIVPDAGEAELFLGLVGESGVVWSAVSADGVKFIERVTGAGDERRLEMLLPEESSGGVTWRLADALKPAREALTSVIGEGVPPAEPVDTMELPSEAELKLVDRVAELMRQRDAVRATNSSVARELATAWRELEESKARLSSLSGELAEAKRALAAATAAIAQPDAALTAKVAAAEKTAAEARTWADEMEKSLRTASARADENATRMADLTRQLEAAQAAQTTAGTETQTARDDVGRLAARVRELEGQVAAAGQGRAGIESELKSLSETRATLELQLDEAQGRIDSLTTEKNQLAARITEMASGAAQTSEALEQQRREALAARTEWQEKVKSVQQALDEKSARVSELEASAAGLQQQLTGARAAAASAAELGAAQRALHEAEAARDEAGRQVAALRDEVASLRAAGATLEQQLTAARSESATHAARATDLEQRATELAQSGGAATSRQAAVAAELAAARAELSMASTRENGLRQSLEDARAASESAAAQSRQVEADLSTARSRVVELEGELAGLRTRSDELGRTLDGMRAEALAGATAPTVDARIAQLEQRLADTFARSDARQQEVEKLTTRIAELEGERQALQAQVTVAAGGPSATADAVLLNRRLAAAESARRDIEQRNAELTRRVRELETGGVVETPPTTVAATRPPPAPAPRATTTEPTVRFQIPTTPTPTAAATVSAPPTPAGAGEGGSTIRYRPTRPAGGEGLVTLTGDTQIAQAVERLAVNGYRREGANSLVVIGGRTYRVGDVVDRTRNVRFTRIDADALVFTGSDGAEYRRRLQ